MKHLFGILVNVNANVINHVFLDNTIYIMKVVNVEKKIINKLVEDCNENIDEILMTVLLAIFSMISIGISCAFICFTGT